MTTPLKPNSPFPPGESAEPSREGNTVATLRKTRQTLVAKKDELDKSVEKKKNKLTQHEARKVDLEKAMDPSLNRQIDAEDRAGTAVREARDAAIARDGAQTRLDKAVERLSNPKPSISMSRAASIIMAFKDREELARVAGQPSQTAPHTKKRFLGPLIGATGAAFEGAGATMVAYGVARVVTQPTATTFGVAAGGVVAMSVPVMREASAFLNQPFEAWEELVRYAEGLPANVEGDEIKRALTIEADAMKAAMGAFLNLCAANGLALNAVVGAITLGCAGLSLATSKVLSSRASDRVTQAPLTPDVEEGVSGATNEKALVAAASDDETRSEAGKQAIEKVANQHRGRDTLLPIALAVGAGLGGLLGAMFLFQATKKLEADAGDDKNDYLATRAFAAAANFALLTKNLISYAKSRFELPAARGAADAKTLRRDRPVRELAITNAQDALQQAVNSHELAAQHLDEAQAMLGQVNAELAADANEFKALPGIIAREKNSLTKIQDERQQLLVQLNDTTKALNSFLMQQLQNKPDDDDDVGPDGPMLA